MPRPWTLLATEDTPDGRLELRRRADGEFLIQIAGRVLMNSAARRSEEVLATRGCAAIHAQNPRVLIGGLGMGCTLRAALDALPPTATVVVAELNPVIEAWCRGPLVEVNEGAIHDPRVTLYQGDVSRYISTSKAGSLDLILLDLYAGPNAATDDPGDPFYGLAALAHQRAALAKGGVLAVWGERRDLAYERRLAQSGFTVEPRALEGAGGAWKHAVYVAVRA
jgi:spermidine synthase